MSDSPVVQEWIDQGTVKTQRHNLLRLLQLRFQSEPPMDLVEQIQRADQVETLSRWFDAAVLAPTIEAFRVAIRPTPGNGTNTNDL